jgi:hypothetical protein
VLRLARPTNDGNEDDGAQIVLGRMVASAFYSTKPTRQSHLSRDVCWEGMEFANTGCPARSALLVDIGERSDSGYTDLDSGGFTVCC